jgi:hypothetical protein
VLTLFVAVTLLQAAAFAEQGTEQRLQALEERVRALTGRVENLERAASPAAQPVRGPGLPADGAVWTFDDYVDASPFKVSYKSFDRATGRVELLLQITAPIEQPELWSETGRSVPVALRYRAADGAEGASVFALVRASRLEPGSRVHLRALVEPALAASASHLSVGRAPH